MTLGDPAAEQGRGRIRVAVATALAARAIASATAGCGPQGDSFEASWAISEPAIDSGALPAGAPAT